MTLEDEVRELRARLAAPLPEEALSMIAELRNAGNDKAADMIEQLTRAYALAITHLVRH